MDLTTKAERNAFPNTRLAGFLPWIQAATVPVYRQGPLPAEHVGTAVLLTIASRIFALTAAHVIDDAHRGELLMGLGDHPVRITGSRAVTTLPSGTTRDADKIDMGFIAFDNRTSAEVSSQSCLTLADLSPCNVTHPDDYYLVAGYPITKQKMRLAENQIDTYLYPLVAVSKVEAAYHQKGLDPGVSLLLGFAKKDTWRSDVGRVTAPDLHGMSGCGAWWLKGYESATLSRPLLDAIAIEWHKDKGSAILSTRVHRVVRDIARLHPETHAEVSLWLASA